MSYTINLTDGAILAVVPDGQIVANACSMTLVGKNYAGYGEFLNENYVYLLENSANDTAPSVPLTGQLWWDSGNNLLKVYNGSVFKTISAATASSSTPTSNVQGDLWFDTTNQLLKVYTNTGNTFLTVGPSVVSGTGAQAVTISDGTTNHAAIQFTVGNTIVGIMSKDSTYTPSPLISGFSTIKPGFQLTSANAVSALFQGTATDSQLLDGLDSTAFCQANTVISVTGIINNNANGVGNIGNSSSYFNTIFAKATSAEYADVAERFAADAEYAPGTVVSLGGAAEITKAAEELTENVFGVISTRAAYLMNSAAGSDATHPPVAMTGRVPVRVVGQVVKGDRLVSAGDGLARAAQPGEATAFNVIGRALVSKSDPAEGTVEAIVTIK